MTELTEEERRIVEAMKSLGARSEEKVRDADMIAKTVMMPKGKVSNLLIQLVNKKVLRRVAREKAAGYYIVDATV